GNCSAAVGGRPVAGSAGLMPGMTHCGPDLFFGGPGKSGRGQPPARSTIATRAARSTRRRRRPVVPLRPLDALPIDAVQQHGQFGGAHGDAGLAFGRRREAENSDLQTLINNHVSIGVPVKQLDSVATAIAKDKDSPNRTPLSGQALPGRIQRLLLSWTRGPSWSWPAGANNNEPQPTEEPPHVPTQPCAPPPPQPPPPSPPRWQDLPPSHQEELLRLLGRMLAEKLTQVAEEDSHEPR